jgi:hypothetical protein
MIMCNSPLLLLPGTKPLSVFGTIHGTQKKKMRKSFEEHYPRLRSDLALPRESRGLLTVLYDHFVDLDVIAGDDDSGSNSSPEEDEKEAEMILPLASRSNSGEEARE